MIEYKPSENTTAAAGAGSSRWAVGIGVVHTLMWLAFSLVILPDLRVSLARSPWDIGLVRNLMPYLMAIFSMIGTFLIWSGGRNHPGRQVVGSWLIVGSLIVGSLAINLLAANYGLLLGVVILLLGSIFADQLLAGRPSLIPGLSQGAILFGLSGLAAAVCILVDFFYSPGNLAAPRSLQSPDEVAAATILTGFFMLLFLVYLAARFRSYRLSTKLALGFLLVALVVGLVTGGFLLAANSRSLTAAAGKGVYTLAETQRRAIGDALARQVDGINVLSFNYLLLQEVVASNDSYSGNAAQTLARLGALDQQWKDLVQAGNTGDPRIQGVLDGLPAAEIAKYSRQYPENVEIFATDRYGAVVAAIAPTSDYYQADEGWWQAAYNQGQGAVYISSPEFDESSQTLSLLLAVPIRDGAGQVMGVLRTTVDLAYIQNLLALAKLGETGEADLLFPDPAAGSGFSGLHMGQYAALPPDEIAALKAVEGFQYGQQPVDGTQSLVSLGTVSASSGQAEITDLGWQIVAHQNVEEALQGVQAQTRQTLLLVLATMSLAALGGLGLARFLSGPIIRLTATAQRVESGDLQAQARVETADEVGELAAAFNSMTAQVRGLVGSLEGRVAERTQALKTSFDVSQRLSTLLDQQDLLTAIVEDVVQSFGYYYAQVYLFDEPGERLVLASGAGEAGQVMLQRGHNLPRGRGLVGRAAEQNQAVLVADTLADPGWLPNPLLPETRSEAAVPLAIGEQVLGVLDVQHTRVNGLGDQDVQLLLSIASQAAVAVQNARLYQQAQAQAEREAIVNRISQQIQSASTPEAVLQIGLRELGELLKARGGSIVLGSAVQEEAAPAAMKRRWSEAPLARTARARPIPPLSDGQPTNGGQP